MSSTIQKLRAADDPAAPTPMMAQYLEIKSKHPDFLLFYRMGDFFELFFDDAVRAADALGIQLTKRGKHSGEDIPMCGVPVVRSDEYLHRLIKMGFRVAIAEQLEEPAAAKLRGAKSVVRRDIVRLVTPGTLTEDTLLASGSSNFLTAIFGDGKSANSKYALASADISTGEFFVGTVSAHDIEGEMFRLRPAEILFSEECAASIGALIERLDIGVASSPRPHSFFNRAKGERALKDTFGVAACEGLGDFSSAEVAAIGALLHYVALTQMGERPALRLPRREAAFGLLFIDAATRASLELVRARHEGTPTVFSSIDKTVTAGGSRELLNRLMSPLADADIINARLDAVAFFVANPSLRDSLRAGLKAAPDMARALSRLKLNRGCPRDLALLRDGTKAAIFLRESLDTASGQPFEISTAAGAMRSVPDEVTAKLSAALVNRPALSSAEGGFIAAGYDAALDAVRDLAADSKRVVARLQAAYAAETGIKALKVQYNNVFGYFVEVSPGSASVLAAAPHDSIFRHKQTLAGAVRFTTEALSALERKILTATADAKTREDSLFQELVSACLEAEIAISSVAAALAVLDCTTALAELAQTRHCVRPVVDGGTCFSVRDGRHLAVEAAAARQGKPFIANGCALDGTGATAPAVLVVTGPNMAGKSTYLRQNALIAVLAQMGSFVPAASAHIGVADRLFCRIGSADDIARGRSTFMVEMSETAATLNQATSRSLVILDEIGRGTSTFDGLSIAWAVLEDLHDRIGCRSLIATHYHELTQLEGTLARIASARMAVKEWKEGLVFLHTVEAGAAQRSYGIEAARLAGVPKPVLCRAREILAHLESDRMPPGIGAGGVGDLPLFAHRQARR